MERIIKVTGKGILKVKPDTIRLIITQTSVEKTHEGAVSESAAKKNLLTEALREIGFAGDALKTLEFNIHTEYRSYQAKDGNWKQKLEGYRYTHRMKLEFSVESGLLGKVLPILGTCPGEPEFSIHYTIADPESAKNELLEKAVCDAKAKAAVLSKAAGVKLGEIVTVNYSFSEFDFVEQPVEMLYCKSAAPMADGAMNLAIEADDIEVEDTVTVVWAIL